MPSLSTGALQYDMVIYTEEQTSGTAAGTFTAGSPQTRILNTVRYSRQTRAWSSLNTGTGDITLQPGKYYIEASAPAYLVNRHIAFFQNTTDGTTDIIGTSQFSTAANQGYNRSFVEGEIEITGTKVYQLQHQCQTSKATDGLGLSSNIITNTYAIVKITKLG